LICISFMVRDGEHFFMFFSFFAIWTSFFENVQFGCLFLYWVIDFEGVVF
jgi:hypothetical protein